MASDDEMDLDAMLDEAADDALKEGEGAEEDLLDSALDDVLAGEVVPALSSSVPSSAPKKPVAAAPKCDRELLEDALTAVLPPEASKTWIEVIREDETRMANLQLKPHSRAYRSLNSGGRPEGNSSDGGAEPGAAGGAATIPPPAKALQELMLRAASKAGIKDTEGMRKAFMADEGGTLKKLQELFMRQMVEDVKERVAADADFDPKRFPHTAERVLGGP